MSAVISLLSQKNWIMLNKDLIKNVGLDEAILIGELCSEYTYWKSQGELDKYDDWFYTTRENIKENTGLSEHKQRNAIDTLKSLGILEVKLMLTPAKTFYHIDADKLAIAIENPQLLDIQKVESLDMQKVTHQEVENPDNINNTKEIILKDNKVNGIPFTPAELETSTKHSKIYASKQANKLTDDLGGISEKDPDLKKEKPKKKSLYQKCLDAIADPVYNFDSDVQNELRDYLSFVLQPTSDHKEVRGINQWTYKLKALAKLGKSSSEQKAIIERSLQLGYYGFFSLDKYGTQRDNKPPVDDLIIDPYRTPEEKKKDYEERAKWGTY